MTDLVTTSIDVNADALHNFAHAFEDARHGIASIGTVVAMVRKHYGTTLDDVAAIAGCSDTHVRAIEKGQRVPDLDVAARLVEWVLTITGNLGLAVPDPDAVAAPSAPHMVESPDVTAD